MLGASAETIFAVASGAGRVAVTLLRISGPASGMVLDRLCRGRPPPRVASLRTLRNGDGEVLDRAIVLWLPGPGSYTGEDSAELHLHGGTAVLAGVAEALSDAGARHAERGEFTLRAFAHGRMDLVEAEAVADLVEADTAAQRRQALRQMDGALGGIYRSWAARLLQLLAQQEALIDFPDEDLPPEVEAELLAEARALRHEFRRHLDDGMRGERLRTGLVFAIAGPPNAGKSTLVNALAGRDVAIVAATPGTTRDVLEVRLDLGGVPVTLLDTAGLREATDPVEAEGVRRARARAAQADLVVLLSDASAPAPCEAKPLCADATMLRVLNKIDLASEHSGTSLAVSALAGTGLDDLREALSAAARALTATSGPPPLTRQRHRAALQQACDFLTRALAARSPELRGEDLRMALRSLGTVTGTVAVDEVLTSVFAQFCIGK